MKSDANLNHIWQQRLPHWHWQRIESSMIGPGIPDLNGCYQGREVWLEMKKAVGIKVNLSVEQVAWHARRTRAGGHTFIAVRKHRRRWASVDSLHLYPGRHADQVREAGLAWEALCVWDGGPAGWDWDQIENLLLK